MRLDTSSDRERGDTIIEVIFAVVVFAMVAVSCLSIMNQGIAMGERALEISLVRQQIKAQAEALRYIHEARIVAPSSTEAVTWNTLLTTYAQNSASQFGWDGSSDCQLPSSGNPFILNARKAQIWGNSPSIDHAPGNGYPPYPQVVYNDADSTITAAYGLWIEAVPSSAPIASPFVDFHIRACWPGPGSSVPITLGTIVRLYGRA